MSMQRSFLLLISAAALAACGEDDPAGPGPIATDGRLRVVPGVAALPLVDVIVDGQLKLSNVQFGKTSSTIALTLGAHQVKVVPPGTAPSAGGVTVTLKANDTTTVVAIGTAAAPSTVALGDTGANPVAGKGKLRVTHLATNAPAVDVYRSQPDFTTFTKFMDPFPYQASSSFVESTPGNWTIRVTARGTQTVLAERSGIPVNALWVRTALLLDAPNNGVSIVMLGEQ
jgi:hypothetical protein